MFKGFLILLTLKYADSVRRHGISGNVLGGTYTNINKYPHAVLLEVHSKINCLCGGSILNQEIVLSAAHCFEDYLGRRRDSVNIKYGATALSKMTQIRMRYYRLHELYDEVTMYGDLALVRSSAPIKFANVVKRVAIMISPPKEKLAYVSGWGSIDHDHNLPKGIKHTHQKLRTRNVCRKYLSLPAGTFCAGPIEGEGHPGGGDSGGALMIKQYIQIGIVSFKEVVTSLVVYTNVSYHYVWIKENTISTFCAKH